MKLIFDLDGTLIDSTLRLYKLFQSLVPNSKLTYDEYWELKRNKINHKEILTSKFNYTTEAYELFEKEWMIEIEKTQWLALDKPFEGVTQMLIDLSQYHKLFLVTARQSEEAALHQIKSFGWELFFNKILVTRQKFNKFVLIKNSIQVDQNDYLIGDTGKDIETGKMLGIKTIAVLSGFLNKSKLLPYGADYIVNYSTEITEIINGKIQK